MIEKISQSELARRAGVSRQAVFKAIKAGKIKIDESNKISTGAKETQLLLDGHRIKNGLSTTA